MAKSTRKNRKKATQAQEPKKAAKGKIKVAECIDCLLELHKLQGELLAQLRKQL